MDIFKGMCMIAALSVFLTADASGPPFPPVKGFELSRYLGAWYEIARLPNSFEKDLVRVTATYSLRPDGMVKVSNAGYRDGKRREAAGKARFAGQTGIAHLKVSFFWIFYSDFIVVELDENYRYALVAGASHDYLWILAREPSLDSLTTKKSLGHAARLGFDIGKLYFTPQE